MFTRVAWRGRAGTLAVMDAQAIAVGVEAIEAGAALSALSLAAPRAEDEGGHAGQCRQHCLPLAHLGVCSATQGSNSVEPQMCLPRDARLRNAQGTEEA